MKIGIDAKDIEGQRTGVGRYLINLLHQWDKLSLAGNLPEMADLEFILYFRKSIPGDLNLASHVFKKKVLPMGHLSNAFYMHFLLARAAKKDKVDLLFCPAYVSPLFYKGKIALTLHDIVYEVRPDLYNWPSIFDKVLLKKFSKISAEKAAAVFVPSEYSKKEVLKHYWINPEKISVTYLGMDQSVRPVKDIKGIRELGIKDKFIFYYGSICNRRHLPETMLAFEKIAKDLASYQFLVIGKNITSPFIDIDGLAGQINRRLGRGAILRKDFVSDNELSLLYGSAGLLVWLSEYEGYGLPVVEALGCGVPVITSPITSIPEVAGEAVLYIQNPKDVDEIYRAIHWGLTDTDLRDNLVKKGIEQVKKFSWQRCAKETLERLTS